jgi:hypothetical protein
MESRSKVDWASVNKMATRRGRVDAMMRLMDLRLGHLNMGALQSPLLVGPALRATEPSSDVSGKRGLAPVHLRARRKGDVLSISGNVGGNDVTLRVTQRGSERHVAGSVGDQDVDLRAFEKGGKSRLEGAIGGLEVDLQTSEWGANQINVNGSVGNDRVNLYAYRQIDGCVLSGFSGGVRLDLRARDITGRLDEMDALSWLPAVLASPSKVG